MHALWFFFKLRSIQLIFSRFSGRLAAGRKCLFVPWNICTFQNFCGIKYSHRPIRVHKTMEGRLSRIKLLRTFLNNLLNCMPTVTFTWHLSGNQHAQVQKLDLWKGTIWLKVSNSGWIGDIISPAVNKACNIVTGRWEVRASHKLGSKMWDVMTHKLWITNWATTVQPNVIPDTDESRSIFIRFQHARTTILVQSKTWKLAFKISDKSWKEKRKPCLTPANERRHVHQKPTLRQGIVFLAVHKFVWAPRTRNTKLDWERPNRWIFQ